MNKDMTGELHGRLTVIRRSKNKSPKSSLWICRCICGGIKETSRRRLLSKTTRSCGCAAREQFIHGMSDSKEYNAWSAARDRCYKPNHRLYPHYGGRGIAMCNEWRKSFKAFLEHVGSAPDGYWIGRIDNDKGYEPGNVHWETPLQQANNVQRTVWIIDPQDGEKMSMANFCRKHNVDYGYFRDRYTGKRKKKNGKPGRKWPIEEVLAKAKLLSNKFTAV